VRGGQRSGDSLTTPSKRYDVIGRRRTRNFASQSTKYLLRRKRFHFAINWAPTGPDSIPYAKAADRAFTATRSP